MTPKYKRIFEKVFIGAALLWVLAFAVDIFLPGLSYYVNPTLYRGHGGGAIMIASPVCLAAVVITLVVCLVKSSEEKKH